MTPSQYDHQSFVSKLYWPGACPGAPIPESGLLVGWNDCNFVANVVAVLPGSDISSLELALAELSSLKSLLGLWEHCSGPPIVIGNCFRSSSSSDLILPPNLDERRRTADFWISVDVSGPLPVLTSVYCCGFLYRTSAQILLYDPPVDCCSYLSVDELTFDWMSSTLSEDIDIDESVTDLQFVLRQISSSAEIQHALVNALHKITADLDVSTRPENVDTLRQRRVPEHASLNPDVTPRSKNPSKSRMLLRVGIKIAHLLLLLLRICCHLTLVFVNARLPMLVGGGRVKDRSAVLQQVDRRIVELTQWPQMLVRTRSRIFQPKEYVNASLICFWSSICQFLVDIVTGLLVGCLLRAYSESILDLIHDAGKILHVDVLRRQVIWLMGLPAGMKLNFALDQSLGSMVLYGIDFWNAITIVLTPLETHIITIVSIIAGCGLSIGLACAIDLLSMMTTHVLFVHTAFSRLYSLSLSALSSLSKLFSGKKHNILQRRIDSCHFDVDQLLLGTILFTLIFFLFPTIAIYYLFFSMVRFLIMLVEAALYLTMAFLNHFPFFELAIYFFNKRRLPSGIRLEVLPTINTSCVYLVLHSCCITLQAVFSRCFGDMQVVLYRYSVTKSLRCLLWGLPIPAHRLDSIEKTEGIYMDFSPGVTGFWFFLKTHLNA